MRRQKSKKMVDNFRIGKTIGCGTFGKVHQGLHILTNQKVAIKILQKKKINNQKDIQRIQKQLEILKSINHPNILKLLEVKQTDKEIYMITQLIKGQQLYTKIVKRGRLTIEEACKYFVQLYQAVKFLHGNNVAHRDIKPENIIVDGQKLKLIDFGLSTSFSMTNHLMETPCGSPCYAAPEMVLGKKYDCRTVDIWAMGVTLFAMVAGRLPFEHQNTQKLYKLIENSHFQELQGLPSYINLLLKAMIEKDPKKRIKIDDISENIWIKDQIKNTEKSQSSLSLQKTKWNLDILKRMQQVFKKSSNLLIKEMKSNQISEMGTYYYLSCKQLQTDIKTTKYSKQDIHEGPFHIQFLFKNHELIEKFLYGHKIQFEWCDQGQNQEGGRSKIRIDEKIYGVKKLKNLPNFLYLPLNKQLILQRTQRQKSESHSYNEETSVSSFYSPNSSRKNICLETF